MNKTIKISAVHYEMLKGIMRRSGVRKEDELIEEMIQEMIEEDSEKAMKEYYLLKKGFTIPNSFD